jgi:hypothetical protein
MMGSDLYALPAGSNADSIEADLFRRQAQIMAKLKRIDQKFDRFVEAMERCGVLGAGEAHQIITGEECLYEGEGPCPFSAMCSRGNVCSRAAKNMPNTPS